MKSGAALVEELTRRFAVEPAAQGESGERRKTYLHPGHLLAPEVPHEVTTILGSCVAVCLLDRSRGVGGINHYLLPEGHGPAQRNPRFADTALPTLLERLAALGSRAERLEAKVFGGACVLDAFQGRPEGRLGERNVEVALAFLKGLKIPVVSQDTGGSRGRKLIFHTDSGLALIRPV